MSIFSNISIINVP